MSGIGEDLYQAAQRNDLNATLEALKSCTLANYAHIDEEPTDRTSVPVLYEACQMQNIKLVLSQPLI